MKVLHFNIVLFQLTFQSILMMRRENNRWICKSVVNFIVWALLASTKCDLQTSPEAH